MEIEWKDSNVENIDALNFENTGGDFHYNHKVYSQLTIDQLKEKGLMK